MFFKFLNWNELVRMLNVLSILKYFLCTFLYQAVLVVYKQKKERKKERKERKKTMKRNWKRKKQRQEDQKRKQKKWKEFWDCDRSATPIACLC